MTPNRSRSLLPQLIPHIPDDFTSVITALPFLGVLFYEFQEISGHIILYLSFILFLPGWAFSPVLVPEAEAPPDSNERESINRVRRITLIKHAMLVFGMSTTFILLLIFLLKYTAEVIQLTPVLPSLSGFLVISAIVGIPYQWKVQLKERFLVASHFKFFNPNSRVDIARKITAGLLLILVVGSIGFAVTFPPQGESFTEFSLLTEDDDGELVAADYPREFVQQEAQPLVVSIKNQEYENIRYTVIIQLERVEERDNKMKITERKELDRFKVTLRHDETRHIHHKVVPTIAGEELRLTYLLYNDEVPEEPSRENAYRDLHIWISVDDSSDEEIEIHQPIDEE